MEREHDRFYETQNNRQTLEKDLDETREAYKTLQRQVDEETRKGRDLMVERDNLKLRIFYMTNAKEDIRGDIAVIRRATGKAEIDKNKLEVEKQRQVSRFLNSGDNLIKLLK